MSEEIILRSLIMSMRLKNADSVAKLSEHLLRSDRNANEELMLSLIIGYRDLFEENKAIFSKRLRALGQNDLADKL